ncbi:MAG: hypothetical protein AAF447_00980 [Myxococcota bacterium]
MNVIGFAVVAALVALAYRAWRVKQEASPAGLWKQLTRLTHDRKVAERLVAAEQKRAPVVSEAVALRRAIRRLEADRRR